MSTPPVPPRILVGVDGSLSAAAALRWAVDDAVRRQGVVQAVYVWGHDAPVGAVDARGAERELRLSVDYALGPAPYPVPVVTTTRRGRPGPVLSEMSRDAALLVVGCRGHGVVGSLLLGSVSQYCTRHAECPVTVVPAPQEAAADQVFVVAPPRLAGAAPLPRD